MEISEILLNLVDRSTIKVRKAAKKLRKYYVKEACPILLEAYKREIKRGSWETQNELIITAGILQCNEFIPYLENICQKNEAHDMVTINTGCSYLRIVRNNLSDVSSIFKYSDGINYSLGKGFLFALGLDKMVPNIDDQEKLISIFYDFGQNRDPLYSDPRYGLAVACAGWKSSKVEGFLNHCKKTGDKYLISVSESSLKGEYVKKHIYGIY